jgi:hypothetical protein
MRYNPRFSARERGAFLFQPDPVFSARYFGTFRRRTPLKPEKILMLAVLENAITCFQDYISARHSKGKNLFREVEGWIFEESGDWLFSFESICEVLGFNPTCLRLGLLRWKERKLNEGARSDHHRLPTSPNEKKPSVRMSGRA